MKVNCCGYEPLAFSELARIGAILPFGFVDGRGQLAGFDLDLARVLATVLFDDERRIQFLRVTTASRFEALRSGQVHLVMATITATEERRA